jgi:N4-gp56 family major capsid protein
LNSGITPPAQNLTAVDIDAKISFYGTYIQLNEQVTLQNQDPVLNEAAARLGVSLRQTEDQLTRDMLASTASAINCVGGVNGRIVAVLKSLVIDLELEVAIS